jgi:exportin-1
MENTTGLAPKDLLDHSIPFDERKVQLLDMMVEALYSKNQQEMMQANQFLTEFQQDGTSWQYADIILENSKNTNTMFIALNVLEGAVKNRWKVLPEDQKNGIKQYISKLVIEKSQDENINTATDHLLNKLDQTLVSIVKHEWTTTWKEFITEICEASKTHQGICENTMNLLKLLSEEIFDFSKDEINSKKANELKETMTDQFASIYDLCVFVLNMFVENPANIKKALVKSCLKTFASFLSWIPFGYIFETDIMEKLLLNFYTVPAFRNDTLPCLVEIASLKIQEDDPKCNEYVEKQFMLFVEFVEKTVEIKADFSQEHLTISETQRQFFDVFCLQMGLLLSEFLKNQIKKIESLLTFNGQTDFAGKLQIAIAKALDYLIQLSNIPNDELFRVMMEFWNEFTYYVMVSTKGREMFRGLDENLMNLQNDSLLINSPLRSEIFPTVLNQLCVTVIKNMAKPEEVLVVVDENGNAVEELITDSETVALYKTMRANLVYLTNIDSTRVYKIMTQTLDDLLANEANFTFDKLNKLCWALGSVSECMMEDEENKFVVTVIKELLNLVEKKKGKNNKALVAADIMYVVGQFPRFLCSHWAFLKTVVKKLNEFMHEKHPGVQDMATEVFLKISKKTKHMFVQRHDNDEPFV